jgi:hypothetical protein
MDNRRKSVRVPIVSVANVTHQDQGRDFTSRILLRDLSIDGLGGYINFPCQKGDCLSIHLKLSSPDSEILEAELKGIICWSTEIDQGEKYAFGLSFTEVVSQNTPLHTYLCTLEKSYLQELEEVYRLP